MVIQQTVDHGWPAGAATAAGCALANVLHATAAGLGLAVLVAHVPQTLAVIRVGGTAYLAWLGAKSLWRAARPPRLEPGATSTGGAAFGEGLITNLLNPSILTFYLVVVPTFVPPAYPVSGFIARAAVHVSLAFACHNTWAALFNQIGHLLRSVRARRVFDATAGLALWWLGARVAFSA